MALLYDRKYSLVIGKPSTMEDRFDTLVIRDGTSVPVFQQEGVDYRTTNKLNAVEITDLQIQVSIKGNATSSASSGGCVIKIFNMAKSTREIVETLNGYVILSAGYAGEGKLPLIFSGQVENFDTRRSGENLITELHCKEGYSVNGSIKVTKSFPRTSTYGDVLHYLAGIYEENGIPTGDIVDDWSGEEAGDRSTKLILSKGVLGNKVLAAKADPQDYEQIPVLLKRPANTPLLGGYSVMGYLSQALEKVCSQMGYVSYITNSRLFIHPKGYTRTVEEFEFSSKQMKSIRKMGSKTGGGSQGKGVDGIKITTFLDGRLDIDKRVRIMDGEYAGSYKILTKAYNLDYEQGSWDTVVTCKQV
jgi:hypothetical protein